MIGSDWTIGWDWTTLTRLFSGVEPSWFIHPAQLLAGRRRNTGLAGA